MATHNFSESSKYVIRQFQDINSLGNNGNFPLNPSTQKFEQGILDRAIQQQYPDQHDPNEDLNPLTSQIRDKPVTDGQDKGG